MVIDDTLFKRWGRQVHHAFWTHDGAAQGGKKIARGNRWVIAGIVVRLPLCTAPVCLPVLMRLWAGKATTTPVELAAQMLALITAAFPDRDVHGVGDAAYHGKPLLVAGMTWTTRLPANACLFDTAPPRTGRRGRPALKGRKLGRPAALATAAAWGASSVYRYGRTETVQLAQVACIWYGSFGNTLGRCVLVRELGSTKAYDLALFTLDQTATPATDRRTVRDALVDRAGQRRRQAADGCRAGPQPGQERRRADRPVRDADPVPGRGLVRPARPSPR